MKADKTRDYLKSVIQWDFEQEEDEVFEEIQELEKMAEIGRAIKWHYDDCLYVDISKHTGGSDELQDIVEYYREQPEQLAYREHLKQQEEKDGGTK